MVNPPPWLTLLWLICIYFWNISQNTKKNIYVRKCKKRNCIPKKNFWFICWCINIMCGDVKAGQVIFIHVQDSSRVRSKDAFKTLHAKVDSGFPTSTCHVIHTFIAHRTSQAQEEWRSWICYECRNVKWDKGRTRCNSELWFNIFQSHIAHCKLKMNDTHEYVMNA